MNRYARISVNIAQVSGVFDYSIPAELAPAIQLGSLVQVPFGKQVVQGIVVALPEEAMVAETRPVEAVIESEPVVTLPQIALAEELAKQNFSTISAFLDLMVPPGLSQHADVRIHLLTEPDANTLAPLQAKIVSLLKKRGDLRGSQLTTALPNLDWHSSASIPDKTASAYQYSLPAPAVDSPQGDPHRSLPRQRTLR